MSDDFKINESHTNFDFQGFLFKIISYWPLFLISLLITFGIALYVNVRKLPVYKMENLISIKDDQNPFFTTNTSLTFNWGGTTDKVNTAIISLKSRSHNEKVVQRLKYYLTYLKQGKYQEEDAYKHTPFFVELDSTKFQILNTPLELIFKDSVNFTLKATFEEGEQNFQKYSGEREVVSQYNNGGSFARKFKIGEKISLPFLNATIVANPEVVPAPQLPFFIKFARFDNAVKNYLDIKVDAESKGSSVLRMSTIGTNKAKLVDYLNTSVDVLSDDMLERKNLFATKTIRFIDSSLAEKSSELKDVENELNAFKNKNAIFNLETEGADINTKLNGLDLQKDAVQRELNYYNVLENYLISHSDYRDVPAPSVAGISETSVVDGVGRIVALAEERNKLQYSYKEGAPIFADLDRKINAVKTVLLENIRSSKNLKNQELSSINRDIGQYDSQIRQLPKEQQELLKIERRYNLSSGTYDLFLSKRSEANLVKAANVSDVQVIDSAKDTGGSQIGPNTSLNYVMALLIGLALPFLFIFAKIFFDNKINTFKDIEKISKIPILGVVGKSRIEGNLPVINNPKSPISESFRALRSSLQFIYKKQGVEGSKTVLITSSVSGEGKTFNSINLASVFALSEKKTVLLGLDLRRPKIFDDFNLDNKNGIVNYLIKDATLNEILQKTQVPYLDIITSGPIPPNPSELLMGERMNELIDELKQHYDYIILDSPPLGLVTDSLELVKYADATLYIVRQNFTNKAMFNIVNDKYRSGEVTNISIVLNYYEEKARYGYGYGYGYGGYGYADTQKNKGLFSRARINFKRFRNRKN